MIHIERIETSITHLVMMGKQEVWHHFSIVNVGPEVTNTPPSMHVYITPTRWWPALNKSLQGEMVTILIYNQDL